MEDCLANTQELCSQNELEDVEIAGWGALFGISKFPSFELVDEKYTVGRSGKIILNSLCPYFSSLSKIHFEISKVGEEIILRDCSQNGTFVNDVKVGKDNTRILMSNDIIALACQKNKAFAFMNLKSTEHLYPMEVRKNYTISKLLGKGACGEVWMAYSWVPGEKVAIKIVDKKMFPVDSKKRGIENEVEILRQLNHPCIVKLKEAIETNDRLFIVMELVEGGELFDRVISVKQFEEEEARVLFYQLVLAIKYLHDNNISHRDLKPENILLVDPNSNQTLIKITDFGLSKFVDHVTMMRTLCGTPSYLAPEVILANGNNEYSFACDIWSMGVILFICLAGYPPFTDERTDLPLREQIIKASYSFPKVHWAGVSADAIDLIEQMLQVDPKKRITLERILVHAWFNDPALCRTVNNIMHPLAEVNSKILEPTKTAAKQANDNNEEDDKALCGEPVVKRKKN